MGERGPQVYYTLERLYGVLDELPREPNTGCKFWEGRADKDGYGTWGSYRIIGEERVPRHVLTRKLGRRILDGCSACHTCDTPECVEEEHLFEGTPKQNSEDMTRKKRSCSGNQHWTRTNPEKLKRDDENVSRKHPELLNPPRGNRQPGAKLDPAKVAEIRELKALGVKQWDIALRFGVSQATISKVLHNNAWSWV